MGLVVLDYELIDNEWDAMGYREILGEAGPRLMAAHPCSSEDNWIILACAGDEKLLPHRRCNR